MSSVSSPEQIRARLAQIRSEVGPGVTVVAATKYVSVEEMSILLEAGIEIAGENRAQDLDAKHAVYGDAFRWHFIGRLQSNKARVVNRICELVHSLDSDSTARRLEIPALVQVDLAGEETKAGVPAEQIEELLALADVRGLSTMPPAAADPERSRAYFTRLRELAEQHGLAQLSMGTTQDYRIAAEEGATFVRVGSGLLRG